jgi:UDP-N-acetylglucosamine transferase subunit ALG13
MGSSCEAQRAPLRRVRAVIFVTVGAQMPFDRLIRAIDEWAQSRARSDIFAQIGPSDFHPKAIKTARFIEPLEFRKNVEAASVIVAHAGMGTIITALEYGKPIIVMPRRGDLRETRNDHQVATVKRLLEQGRVMVAFDEQQLIKALDQFETSSELKRIEPHASPRLISTLRSFVENKPYSLEPPISDTGSSIHNRVAGGINKISAMVKKCGSPPRRG